MVLEMGDTRACHELSIELAADYETVTVLEQLLPRISIDVIGQEIAPAI